MNKAKQKKTKKTNAKKPDKQPVTLINILNVIRLLAGAALTVLSVSFIIYCFYNLNQYDAATKAMIFASAVFCTFLGCFLVVAGWIFKVLFKKK